MDLKGVLLTLGLNYMGFHTSWSHKMYKWRKKNTEVQFWSMVSIKLSSVRHKTWQSGDTLWQYGAVCQGACLCGLIACIGSDWHGIGVPTWVSSYSDLPFGPWHASDSNNLFILHTGSFIDAYGRLMTEVRWTKVVSDGAPSHRCISSAAHFVCWGMNQPQSVLE